MLGLDSKPLENWKFSIRFFSHRAYSEVLLCSDLRHTGEISNVLTLEEPTSEREAHRAKQLVQNMAQEK